MPIYPYLCEQCGHEFDRLQKISDDPLLQCPECGEESLRKKLTAAAFRLKGTGWYETDFKDKKSTEKTDSADSKSSDKKEDKKSGDKAADKKSGDSAASSTSSTSASTSSTKKSESTKSDSG